MISVGSVMLWRIWRWLLSERLTRVGLGRTNEVVKFSCVFPCVSSVGYNDFAATSINVAKKKKQWVVPFLFSSFSAYIIDRKLN